MIDKSDEYRRNAEYCQRMANWTHNEADDRLPPRGGRLRGDSKAGSIKPVGRGPGRERNDMRD